MLFYYCKRCSKIVLYFFDIIQNYPYCTYFCEWKLHSEICEKGKEETDG